MLVPMMMEPPRPRVPLGLEPVLVGQILCLEFHAKSMISEVDIIAKLIR